MPDLLQRTQPLRRYLKFHGLMPYRVHEILLLSSVYDAFTLEEDGPLTDQLFSGYFELNLSQTPRITHVTNGAEALRLLSERRFDLVITVVRVEDTDAAEFSKQVRDAHSDIPIGLVIFDERDVRLFADGVLPETIDHVFLWTGDASMLIAAIKLVEDERNAEHDTTETGVQVIVVVEDKLRASSQFLALLYRELLEQSHSLIHEGLNELHRLVRMRARAKILLARDFETGLQLCRQFSRHLMALITDMSFPRGGVERPNAGSDLVRIVRDEIPDTPILVQTADVQAVQRARAAGTVVIDKRAADFPAKVRHFLRESLGFGPFIFRLPDGTEVGRARDVFDMEEQLGRMPAESIYYHGSHNHFSTWLNARSMFALAGQVRRADVDEFPDLESVRDYLIRVLGEARLQVQSGVITDFSPKMTAPKNRFVRVGRGSIGGKGRSIAFINSLIINRRLRERFEGLEIRIPKTIVIGTEEYDRFAALNDIDHIEGKTDQEITQQTLDAPLPRSLLDDLSASFDRLKGPLAVRSSSLLEDSRFLPFAGVYATYMLPNNHPSRRSRFEQLCQAIAAVYASAWWNEAREYVASTPHVHEEEKMAVVIQQVVGQRYTDRFYPHLSGVAKSYSYYAVGDQKPEDGIAEIALGLGEMVVSGGAAVRFSPGDPTVLTQFSSAKAMLQGSQSRFFALDMTRPNVDLVAGPDASLRLFDLADAEEDGTFALAGSVYSPTDDVIRENLKRPGPRVVTFNNILKWDVIPLAHVLQNLLRILRDAIGSEVEMEFAVDMGDWNRKTAAEHKRMKPRLYVLQVRPIAADEAGGPEIDLEELPAERVICRTERALGHGVIQVNDIVYVTRPDLEHRLSRDIAVEVRDINARLLGEQTPFMLIGPGRWGTADPGLGIPVDWTDLAGAQVIIETPLGDRGVEPSQGSHFFQNVIAHRIGYLTVTPRANGVLDRAWLDALPAIQESENVRHIRLDAPVSVYVDGRRRCAAIVRP